MISGYIRKMVWVGMLMILAAPAWAQRAQGLGNPRGCVGQNCLINAISTQELDAGEAAGLIHMREEEKLARDVYTKLYAKWGARAFYNISLSEQRHMDAVGRLLERYGLADPAENKAAGEFQNPDFQDLYLELTKRGEQSLVEAFKVGAEIEEMDIRDLEGAIASTDNDDLLIVYRNLLWGSQNHLRAFIGHLEALGESYSPKYLSEAQLTDILSAGSASGTGTGGRGRAAGSRNR